MKKGNELMAKPLMAVMSLILFIMVLVFMYIQLSSILSGPCWKETLKGLEFFKRETNDDPRLVMDPECMEKVIFTSSPVVCKLACSRIDDGERMRECSAKCSVNASDRGKTFIIAVPLDRGILKRTSQAVSNRNVEWIFPDKMEVFVADCEIIDLTGFIGEDGNSVCTKDGNSWECFPRDVSATYMLKMTVSTGDICTIEGLRTV